jgi:hypothetical protein
MMSNRELNNLRRLLRQLRKPEGINPYAVAFILTERMFRGPFFRMGEFLYSIMFLLIFRIDPKITLGHCQVSFPYWRRHYGTDTLSLLMATWSLADSYQLCCNFLAANEGKSIQQMLVSYNGKPSKIYVEYFTQNLRRVRVNLEVLKIPVHDPLAGI